MQKQLSYMLGRQQIFLELNDDIEESDELTEIMSNAPLNGAFLSLAREVGAVFPFVAFPSIGLEQWVCFQRYCGLNGWQQFDRFLLDGERISPLSSVNWNALNVLLIGLVFCAKTGASAVVGQL